MSASRDEARFIVLEGVDGAGTTTHTKLLAKALTKQGLLVRATCEPSDGPVGALIRQVLTRRVVASSVADASTLDWDTMGLLFAADRLDHLRSEVVPALRSGVSVISDRYTLSSLAYQSLTAVDAGRQQGEALEWLRILNHRAIDPDLTVVLSVRAEVAAERRASRSGSSELFEVPALQQRLVEFYDQSPEHFGEERICVVDANRSVDEVHRSVFDAVRARLNLG